MPRGKVILDSTTAHVLYVLGELSPWVIRYFRLSRLSGKSKESFLKDKSDCQGSADKQLGNDVSEEIQENIFMVLIPWLNFYASGYDSY